MSDKWGLYKLTDSPAVYLVTTLVENNATSVECLASGTREEMVSLGKLLERRFLWVESESGNGHVQTEFVDGRIKKSSIDKSAWPFKEET